MIVVYLASFVLYCIGHFKYLSLRNFEAVGFFYLSLHFTLLLLQSPFPKFVILTVAHGHSIFYKVTIDQ